MWLCVWCMITCPTASQKRKVIRVLGPAPMVVFLLYLYLLLAKLTVGAIHFLIPFGASSQTLCHGPPEWHKQHRAPNSQRGTSYTWLILVENSMPWRCKVLPAMQYLDCFSKQNWVLDSFRTPERVAWINTAELPRPGREIFEISNLTCNLHFLQVSHTKIWHGSTSELKW